MSNPRPDSVRGSVWVLPWILLAAALLPGCLGAVYSRQRFDAEGGAPLATFRSHPDVYGQVGNCLLLGWKSREAHSVNLFRLAGPYLPVAWAYEQEFREGVVYNQATGEVLAQHRMETGPALTILGTLHAPWGSVRK